MAGDEQGFFGRWSRRKLGLKRAEDNASPEAPTPALRQRGREPAAADPPPLGEGRVGAAPPPPPPTLADAAALTPESDFGRFVAADVSPQVKNAAMKKLFADPRYNVMDGLDVYIDDYGRPDPLSPAQLAQLASAQALGLLRPAEPEPQPQPQPPEIADAGTPPSVAQSQPADAAGDTEVPDAHPDLRLQQDPAPGPEGPGQGPR